MNTIYIIAKKEFKAYFVSPIAYVYIITFLVLTSWMFFRAFYLIGQANMRPFFAIMPWIFLFFIPAVSMSKWSEEKKLGTIELLLTLPVRDIHVILGKFFASLLLIIVSLILTCTVPITVLLLGGSDLGPIIGGYLGLVFLGAAYLAIGLFISALTENQIIAFILSLISCFMLLVVGETIVTSSMPDFLVGFMHYASLGSHFSSIGRGVLDSRDIIYYVTLIIFFLWLNLKAIQVRAWK